MANMIEIGTVVWFNSQKRFGFLEDFRGNQIFFHFNDGRYPKVSGHDAEYGDATILGFDGRRWPLPDPQPGDVLVFERTKGSKGRIKASPWTYEYKMVQAFLDYERENTQLECCGHLEKDHAGGECMECHCGDPAYEYDEEEPRIVNLGGDPGGFTICE